jgi:hypothetical protein
VFGNNLAGTGRGGQGSGRRGEPNAVGRSTKRRAAGDARHLTDAGPPEGPTRGHCRDGPAPPAPRVRRLPRVARRLDRDGRADLLRSAPAIARLSEEVLAVFSQFTDRSSRREGDPYTLGGTASTELIVSEWHIGRVSREIGRLQPADP